MFLDTESNEETREKTEEALKKFLDKHQHLSKYHYFRLAKRVMSSLQDIDSHYRDYR